MSDEALRLPIGSPRTLLAVHALLWLAASFDLFKYVLNRPIASGDLWPSLCILFTLGWLALLGLHGARVLRGEVSETEVFMSDSELYEIARKRIDKRNRQWFFLGADILAYFTFIAAFAALHPSIPHNLPVFVLIVWTGILAFHTLIALALQSRSAQIDREVARLRAAVYEKPKRLEMSDDGELIDFTDEAQPSMKGDSE